jgi:hypothetical protein
MRPVRRATARARNRRGSKTGGDASAGPKRSPMSDEKLVDPQATRKEFGGYTAPQVKDEAASAVPTTTEQVSAVPPPPKVKVDERKD